MTAPDDVRARFEAWLASQGFTSKPEQRPNGKYVNGQIQGNWLAWQAAHADLAGEVRELVEALQAARDHGAMTGDEWVIDKVDAALAKFHPTHQEKP